MEPIDKVKISLLKLSNEKHYLTFIDVSDCATKYDLDDKQLEELIAWIESRKIIVRESDEPVKEKCNEGLTDEIFKDISSRLIKLIKEIGIVCQHVDNFKYHYNIIVKNLYPNSTFTFKEFLKKFLSNISTEEIPLYLTERDKEGTVSTYRVVYDEDEKRFVKDLIDVVETKKKPVIKETPKPVSSETNIKKDEPQVKFSWKSDYPLIPDNKPIEQFEKEQEEECSKARHDNGWDSFNGSLRTKGADAETMYYGGKSDNPDYLSRRIPRGYGSDDPEEDNSLDLGMLEDN